MKRTELWAIYVRRNPSFESSEMITMSKAGLKKLFEQTYDQGWNEGYKLGAALPGLKSSSLFGKIFG